MGGGAGAGSVHAGAVLLVVLCCCAAVLLVLVLGQPMHVGRVRWCLMGVDGVGSVGHNPL